MAVGDVTVNIVKADALQISGALEAMYVSANDKWLMTDVQNGQQVILAHVEEA